MIFVSAQEEIWLQIANKSNKRSGNCSLHYYDVINRYYKWNEKVINRTVPFCQGVICNFLLNRCTETKFKFDLAVSKLRLGWRECVRKILGLFFSRRNTNSQCDLLKCTDDWLELVGCRMCTKIIILVFSKPSQKMSDQIRFQS